LRPRQQALVHESQWQSRHRVPIFAGMSMFAPSLRAAGQLDDPVFIGTVARSVGWSALAFVALEVAVIWGAHAALADFGWWSWLASLLGGVGAALLAVVLFVPLATGIATLFIDRISDAVEHRHYPGLPPTDPAPLSVQMWDGLVLTVQVLALQIVGLAVALLLPGPGFLVAWGITAWAIGRGLFVAVAMRRMDLPAARALYRQNRVAVLVQGGVMAAAAMIPPLNLIVPVLGTAAMVHVLHRPVFLRFSNPQQDIGGSG
jgi:CysZ protein